MNASEGLVVLADGTPSAATATATAATFTTTEEGVVVGDDIKAWIAAAQGWALTVACVGGVGNLLTIFTIAHQLYLGSVWRRRSFQHRHHHHHYHHQQQQQHQEQDHQHHHHHHHQPRQNAYLYPNVSCSSRPVVVLEGDTLLLLHLSICDFLYCVINLPLTAYTYNYALEGPGSRPSQNFCQGAAFFRYVNALAEWTTLGLLTVQRCVDLGRLRGARFFRPRPTLIFILAIWVGSVLLQMPAIVNEHFSYDRGSFKCDLVHEAARGYFYSLQSLLPCALVCVGCGSIIRQVRANTAHLLQAGMPEEVVVQRCRSMVRSTALILALLLLFLACVLPVCAYNLTSLFYPSIDIRVNIVIYWMYWVQYGINFIVYAAVNSKFREAYRCFLKSVVREVASVFGFKKSDLFMDTSATTYKPVVTGLMLAVPHLHTAGLVSLPTCGSPWCQVSERTVALHYLLLLRLQRANHQHHRGSTTHQLLATTTKSSTLPPPTTTTTTTTTTTLTTTTTTSLPRSFFPRFSRNSHTHVPVTAPCSPSSPSRVQSSTLPTTVTLPTFPSLSDVLAKPVTPTNSPSL